MASQLTERQKEIKQLLDQGNTPGEVAAALGISENAVYQQRRRIKDGNKTKSRPAPARVAPARVAPTKPPISPVEAIKARRRAITAELATTQAALDAADKALKHAQDAHAKATQKHADELTQLDRAEALLTGRQPERTKRQTTKRSSAKRPTPATNGSPDAVTEQVAEERPGAATVPEFAQVGEPFEP